MKWYKDNFKTIHTQEGFSAFFLVVVIAFAIFMAGAFQSFSTINPSQGISDPNNPFANQTSKESLQLRTLNFVTVTPPPDAPEGTSSATKTALCTDKKFNKEPDIFAGYTTTANSGGQIKVWISDENAPCVATGEVANPTSGLITTVGTRAEKAPDGYLWEPAIYVAPGLAETAGTPHFPTMIKGPYNNAAKSGGDCSNKTNLLHGPAIDPIPAGGPQPKDKNFQNEYVWDVNSLGLPAGTHQAELMVWDGDDDRGVACVNINIQ